jgi:hypothetical protein
MAPRPGTTTRQRIDLSPPRRQRVAAARLAELAPADLPARGQECGRDRRHAPLPTPRILRVPAAVGGTVTHLRRRAGRTLSRDARQALRRGPARARSAAPETGRRGHSQRPRTGAVCARCAPSIKVRGRRRSAHSTLKRKNAHNCGRFAVPRPLVGDTGLEPVTSALSRRRSPS